MNRLALTTRQAIAHASPCYAAEDTTKARFWWSTLKDGRYLSVIMTVNVGLE